MCFFLRAKKRETYITRIVLPKTKLVITSTTIPQNFTIKYNDFKTCLDISKCKQFMLIQ